MRSTGWLNTGGFDSLKVLLISHNPVTTYNNMGKTFLALFSSFQPDELCQLYLYPTIPDTDCCGSYYRFTDRDALRSLVDRRAMGGEVFPDLGRHNEFSSEKEELIYRSPWNQRGITRLGRDLVWGLSNWNNAALRKWLDQQAPDLVFAAVGEQELLYNVAMAVARQRNIPLVSYVCDDYYYSHEDGSLIQKLRRKHLRGKIRELMRTSALAVTICRELTNEYTKTFGVKSETVMTCPVIHVRSYADPGSSPRHLVYMGNIELGRAQSLLELGQALDAENRTLGTAHTLEIYTGNKCSDLLESLTACPAIRLHGFVTGAAYKAAFDRADAFVHVESFDEKNRERVRYSVSTKIIECLASGRPLLAYGPREIASMAYLRRNDCAALACSRQDLSTVLEAVLTQEPYRAQLVERATTVADYEAGNSCRLHQLLESVLRNQTQVIC